MLFPLSFVSSVLGCAVRLGQELGIHNLYSAASERKADTISWHEERCLRTWICESFLPVLTREYPNNLS
jgi:hypothetical protein